MLTIINVRDWLSALLPGDKVYAGFTDANQVTCIGVYQRDAGGWNQAFGSDSTYQRFECKLLVHWSKDVQACETKAEAVFNLIKANRKTTIDTHKLVDILFARPPVNLGRDANGIFESVVLATIIYEV